MTSSSIDFGEAKSPPAPDKNISTIFLKENICLNFASRRKETQHYSHDELESLLSNIGSAWKIAEFLFKNQIDWCEWIKYYERFILSYQGMFGGDYIDRFSFRTDAQAKLALKERYERIYSLASNIYIPSCHLDLCYFEHPTNNLNFVSIFLENYSLDVDEFWDYFLSFTYDSRIFSGSSSILKENTLLKLRQEGLLLSGVNSPPLPVLSSQSLKTLKEIANFLGLAIFRTKKESVDSIIKVVNKDGDVWKSIIDGPLSGGEINCVMPPSWLSWDDFQSLRQQYKSMGYALLDVLSNQGEHRHKSHFELLYSNNCKVLEISAAMVFKDSLPDSFELGVIKSISSDNTIHRYRSIVSANKSRNALQAKINRAVECKTEPTIYASCFSCRARVKSSRLNHHYQKVHATLPVTEEKPSHVETPSMLTAEPETAIHWPSVIKSVESCIQNKRESKNQEISPSHIMLVISFVCFILVIFSWFY